jgi:signal transduction histidine kinase
MEVTFARLRAVLVLLFMGLSIVATGQAWAQSNTVEDEHARLVSKLAKYVTWAAEPQQPTFIIGVYDDEAKYQNFSQFYKNKGVKGKDIIVQLVKTSSEAKEVNILYVPSPNKPKSLNLTSRVIDDANVLVITEGINELASTMIDITYDNQSAKINFRVVEDNIDNKNITIPDLSYILSNQNDDDILTVSPSYALKNKEAQKLLALQNKLAQQESSIKKLREDLKASNRNSEKVTATLKGESERLESALQEANRINKEIKGKDEELQRLEAQLREQEVQLNMTKEEWQTAEGDKSQEQESIIADLTQRVEKQKAIANSTNKKLTEATSKNNALSIFQILFYVFAIIAVITLAIAVKMWKKSKSVVLQPLPESEQNEALVVREQQLIKSENYAALGYIATDIIYAVSSSLDDLQSQLESEGDTKSTTALKPVLTLLDNLNLIAADQDDTEFQNFDVIDYLQKMMSLYQAEFNQTDIKYDYTGEQALTIKSVPSYIALVLIHVINNSLKHGFDNNGNGKITLNVEKSAKGGAKIKISDDGKGMSKSVLEQVFTPFFTTQAERGYVGVGMSTTYDLVNEKLAGDIKIDSKEGKGTTVIITLP